MGEARLATHLLDAHLAGLTEALDGHVDALRLAPVDGEV